MRSAAYVLIGAILAAGAALLGAGALIAALAMVLPVWAALLIGAGSLATGAAIAFSMTRREGVRKAATAALAAVDGEAAPVRPAPRGWKDVILHALETEARTSPAKAAALAVIAGIAVGAMDAIDDPE